MTARNQKAQEPQDTSHRMDTRRMIRFVLIVATILLLTNAFVCATWSFFFDVPGWLYWQVIPASLPVAFIATTILGFRLSNVLLRTVYSLSAMWLGLLNYVFFAALVCWIVAGIVWLAGLPLPRVQVATALFGVALMTALGGLVNAAWLRVTRVVVTLPNLPDAWVGRTVALVTDLHLGHISGPGFLRRVLARLRTEKPEAVLVSGDMFDGSPIGLDRLVAPWREFSTPRGVFYVTGNHDEFAERSLYINAVARTGVRVLNNEKITIDGLQIVGVHDAEMHDPDLLRSILRQAQLDPQRPSILLAHQPMHLDVAEAEGISLQVSGHTHGGQLWPWNRLVSRIYGRFASGLNRLGRLQVYTSNGAGTWGPPLRVETKSEVVLILLTRSSLT